MFFIIIDDICIVDLHRMSFASSQTVLEEALELGLPLIQGENVLLAANARP